MIHTFSITKKQMEILRCSLKPVVREIWPYWTDSLGNGFYQKFLLAVSKFWVLENSVILNYYTEFHVKRVIAVHTKSRI